MTNDTERSDVQAERSDLLYGVPAIARHLGRTTRQARHNIDKRRIPTFRMGAIICARKSTLLRWMEEQERAG